MDTHNYITFSNKQYIAYAFAILLLLWILLREVRNWYWKHNQMILLMQEISEKLTKVNDSINMQNNSMIHTFDLDNTPIKEAKVEEIIIEKKPKENIWTKKLF